MLRRIAVITQAVAFAVTGLLVLLALGLLVTSDGGARGALPELTLLGVALVAFLLASTPYVVSDARAGGPVVVRVDQGQVELLARVLDETLLPAVGAPPRPPARVDRTERARHRAR
jgi:hypothetical protein